VCTQGSFSCIPACVRRSIRRPSGPRPPSPSVGITNVQCHVTYAVGLLVWGQQSHARLKCRQQLQQVESVCIDSHANSRATVQRYAAVVSSRLLERTMLATLRFVTLLGPRNRRRIDSIDYSIASSSLAREFLHRSLLERPPSSFELLAYRSHGCSTREVNNQP
jgi:hypothetical protein